MTRSISSLLGLALTSFLFLLSGCGYTRDSLLAPPRAARRLGCVDLAVRTVADSRVPLTSAVVAFDFGNRCWHATPLDLSRVVVTGITAKGETIPLTPFDPEHAIAPERLEASTQASEAVRYDSPKSHFDAHGLEPLERVCVDLTGVNETEGNREPFCFAAQGSDSPLQHPDSVDLRRGPKAFADEWKENAKPPVRVEIGVSGHSVATIGQRLYNSTLGGVDSNPILGDRFSAATFDLRVTGFVAGPVYVGGLLSVGAGGANRIDLQTRQGIFTTEPVAAQSPMGAIVGVATPRVAGVEGRVEVLAGGRLTSASASNECREEDCGHTFIGGAWLVMPRVAADLWITPFMSIAPWGGLDIAHLGDFGAGVALSFHARPFDGR